MNTQTSALPKPNFPMVFKVVSRSIFSEQVKDITWVLGQVHPLMPNALIVRMFVTDGGGVEVYSAPKRGQPGDCTRHLLSAHLVSFVEEVMPIDVFIEELDLAEAVKDEESEEEEEMLPPPELSLVAPNGQPPVS